MTIQDNKEKLSIYGFGLLNLLLHLYTNIKGAYGFFRDELYYIACSEHMDLGYVDHPPLSIYLLKISRVVLGDSLVAIRFIPAMAISATIIMTGLITREMGGKHFSIFLACLAVLVCPILTALGGYYSMNSIDNILWALSFYLIIRLIKVGKPNFWIGLGFLLGLGLLNKISFLFLGAGLLGGLLLTEQRKWLTTKWPYLAGTIAFLIFLPFIIWNINHDFAHIEFIQNASGIKYSGRTHSDFLYEVFLYHHPFNLVIYTAGFFALIFYKPLKPFKIFAWIFLIVFLILFINRTSKGEYLSPALIILFAGGAIYLEQLLRSRKWLLLKIGYPTAMIVVASLLLPLALPILPVEQFISYSKRIGMEPSSNEKKEVSELPQFYADMFGWEEKARDIAKVYRTLSEEEKRSCVILSDNYGRCGAIDFLGEKYGLPKSIGTHNSYWTWGPGEKKGEVMIILGGDLEDHIDNFQSVKEALISNCKYCMPYENHVKIFLCKKIKTPLKEIWLEEKHYE